LIRARRFAQANDSQPNIARSIANATRARQKFISCLQEKFDRDSPFACINLKRGVIDVADGTRSREASGEPSSPRTAATQGANSIRGVKRKIRAPQGPTCICGDGRGACSDASRCAAARTPRRRVEAALNAQRAASARDNSMDSIA
jgi:hypothetical protein